MKSYSGLGLLLLCAPLLAQTPHVHGPGCGHDGWLTEAELVATAALGASSAGEGYEAALAVAHTDPMHTGLAFGGAELGAVFSRGWGDGHLALAAVFHVHRHPGETTESELDEIHASWSRGALRLRAGIFYAPIGSTNPRHAHEWDFANAPLLYGRFLGERGLLNPGAQLAWGDPEAGTVWTLAVQRATGDTAASFRSGHAGEDFLGRVHDPALGSGPLLTVRMDRAYRWSGAGTLRSGLSAAAGDNGTGGATRLVAWDLGWTLPVEGGGRRSLQAEFLWRDYEALAGVDTASNPVAADRLQDAAFALSAVTTVGPGWEAGLRVERAVPLDRADYESAGRDAAREARTRLSPLLAWRPAPDWHLRLQYDHDRSPAFGTEDSVWLTAQWSVGHGH